MILCVTKNGELYARTEGEGNATEYDLNVFESEPEYPTQSAGDHHYWDLKIVNNELVWVSVERPLTIEEKLLKMEKEMEELKNNISK